MIKEFPAHDAAGKIDAHDNFNCSSRRERDSWQEQYAQLCIRVLCTDVGQDGHNGT